VYDLETTRIGAPYIHIYDINSPRVNEDLLRIMDTLHIGQYTYLIISRSFLRTMRNISGIIIEKFKTHILRLVFLNRVIYEIMWKNVVEPDRPQITIWRMPISRWVPKATNTLSDGRRNAPQYYVTRTLPVLFSVPVYC